MRILLIFLIFCLISNCTINKDVKSNTSEHLNKTNESKYSINDINVNLIKINKLTETQLEKYNNFNLNTLEYSVKKIPEIYDYNYQYILGSSDKINLNLTDTDDIDNSYTIDPLGNIDLPFVGKINIDNLSLEEAKNKLISELKKYYQNPELQINIDEYNSSKIYVLGAVKSQQIINLDEKPLKLIDAVIKADYSPNAQNREAGSKGILRRDNKVYKIDLNNIFKSIDDRENFYLKKNDVLFIDKNSDSIQVFGEISKPGLYFPNENYSLTELISIAGINNITANKKKLYVLREDLDKFLKINIFQIDVSKPKNLFVGKKFLLKPKDIVIIPAKPIVKWNRAISLLLPQTDLFNSYNPIIQTGVKSNSSNLTE